MSTRERLTCPPSLFASALRPISEIGRSRPYTFHNGCSPGWILLDSTTLAILSTQVEPEQLSWHSSPIGPVHHLPHSPWFWDIPWE